MFCLHWSECCSFCWRRWIREKDQVTTSIFALWKDFYSKIWFFGCFQAESTSVFICYLSKKIHSRGTFVMSIHSVGIFFCHDINVWLYNTTSCQNTSESCLFATTVIFWPLQWHQQLCCVYSVGFTNPTVKKIPQLSVDSFVFPIL